MNTGGTGGLVNGPDSRLGFDNFGIAIRRRFCYVTHEFELKTTATNTNHVMKPSRILLIIAALGAGLTSQAASVLPSMIPNNVSPTFTTGDGLLTINGFSDSASTVPANLATGGGPSWFGDNTSSGALNNTDTLKLQLAPSVGLTGFGDIWTRAVITISGFTADPGLNVGSNPGVLGSSYGSGALVLNLDWNGGGTRDFTLENPSASAGQLLTVSLDSATAPQWAITHLDYSGVPEPGSVALLILGGFTARLAARRARG